MAFSPPIPVDIYESEKEIVMLIPLWGIEKETLHLSLQDYKLKVKWIRRKPSLRKDFHLIQEECYRGPIELSLSIPTNIIYDQIHSNLTKENILAITLPKYGVPTDISIDIEES